RGYTGHEHMDEVGLIHMNGRVYDGKLARFVQADPIIQDPLRVQSLNRYSYVWNNPLNATDPSGFCKATVDLDKPGCPSDEKPKDSKPVEEIVTKGERTAKSRDSGFTYKITDRAAINQWLHNNGMTFNDFDSM